MLTLSTLLDKLNNAPDWIGAVIIGGISLAILAVCIVTLIVIETPSKKDDEWWFGLLKNGIKIIKVEQEQKHDDKQED